PDILLAPDASYETATLDGKGWERPEVFYAVLSLLPQLPHIRGALVAFFEGSLEIWRRFMSEFREDGQIAALTDAQKQQVWIHATNDANEGALGAFRVTMRRSPNMTLRQYNSRTMFKENGTEAFYESLDSEDVAYVRKKAREIDTESPERKRRQNIANEEEEIARTKKAKFDERIE
ncbi:hypothetical protein K474DRAFT_1579713, partial [Panus rudis PR-1116 ss-1]